VETGDWKAAVNMYRSNELWEDAYRVRNVYLFYNLSRAQSCHYLEEFCKYTERLILNYLIKMSLKHPK